MTARHARDVWAELRTRVHVAWIYRRDRNPWPWLTPLLLVVVVLRPH